MFFVPGTAGSGPPGLSEPFDSTMKIKGVEFGGSPRAAAVITGALDKRAVTRAVREGADLIEVRVDTFADRSLPALKAAFERALCTAPALPVILTVRSAREGGRYPIPDRVRAEIFEALLPFADLVDIELSSVKSLRSVMDLAVRRGKKVIVSYHNFKSTPVELRLRAIVEKARASGAHIVKIAAMARGRADFRRLAGLLAGSKGLIVIAMGPVGGPSRVFFPLLGSLVTYGSLGDETAPGQLPLKTLARELRFFESL